MSIPLIDNTGRSDRLKAAHSKITQVNHLKSQAERDLSLLVEKNWREAGQALEEYKGLISSVELAKENLRLREKAFAQGLSTSLDVIDAELYVVGAKTQQLSAAYQYVLSLSRLLAVSGQMDDFSTYQRQAANSEVTS
ncbi:TolC family protein [Veronia nyctiphanis]|uniref:TolC family protein n=1 Tax=Veronia nyctiphanis TaxID=1278244 RepID=UPI002E255971